MSQIKNSLETKFNRKESHLKKQKIMENQKNGIMDLTLAIGIRTQQDQPKKI